MDIAGKVAVVTGGANGIGCWSALAFARKGADVVLADLDEAGLERTGEEVRAVGGSVLAIKCDVSSDEDVGRLAARTIETFSRADIIMLNAAVAVGGRWESIPVSEWTRVFDVNVLGVARGIHAFLPHMLSRGEGRFVITTSGLLEVPDGYSGPYSASKFAVTAMAQSLALYGRDYGVGVTLLAPGLTDTAFPRSAIAWGRKGRRTTADRPVEGAARADDVAALLVSGVEKDCFLVATDPGTQNRLIAFARDPDAHVR